MSAEGERSRQNEKATVVLHVTDGLGVGLDGSGESIVSFESLDNRKDLAKSFHQFHGWEWTARRIPFGHYKATIRGEKFGVIGRLVDVYNDFVDIEVPTRYATVHVEFKFDLWNNIVPSIPSGKLTRGVARVKSFRNIDRTEFSSQFKSCQADNIPYGTYEIKIDDPLNGEIRRVVDVFKPEVWVLSGLLAYGEYPAYSSPKNVIVGTVRNIPKSEEPIYVKMMGIYFEATLDDRVAETASSGTFSLVGYSADGAYLLLTIGRSGVLDEREITLPHAGPIEIDLKNPHPPHQQM
jgi:hypothetical protein